MPTNSLIIPAIFWKEAPLSMKSSKYLANSLMSESRVKIPREPKPLPNPSAKPLRFLILSIKSIKPCAIFQEAKAVPTAATYGIRLLMVSFNSSIFVLSSSLIKVYSGSSKSKPPPPPPIPDPPPDPLVSSSGRMIFSSSIPRRASFSSFAFLPAPPRLSSIAPAVSATPPAAPPRPLQSIASD